MAPESRIDVAKSLSVEMDAATNRHPVNYQKIVNLVQSQGWDWDVYHATIEERSMHPLLLCCVQNKPDYVKLFLRRNVGPRRSDQGGRTPLHAAACIGAHEIVEALLFYGADVDATDAQGRTPLHDAAQTGRYDSARTLLEWSAKVNARSFDGSTPAALAARRGSLPLLQLLYQHGGNITAVNYNGESVIDLARSRGYVAVADWIARTIT